MLAQLTGKTHALISPSELNKGPPLSIQGAQTLAASPQGAFLKSGLNHGFRPVMLREDGQGWLVQEGTEGPCRELVTPVPTRLLETTQLLS